MLIVGCKAYDPNLLVAREKLTRPKQDGGIDPAKCATAPDLSICSRPHADGVCLDGDCSIVRCRDKYFDCDKLADNGCESMLDKPEHCGACGAACALPNVLSNVCQPSAAGGPCVINHDCAPDAVGCVKDAKENGCAPGFADCDGMAASGCETSLHSLQNCGACGVPCSIVGSDATCDSGSCKFVSCANGFGDCGGGCQSLAGDTGNCGACGHGCPTNAKMCSGGRCTSLSCKASKADCDGDTSNDCEADLTSAKTCGRCDVSCGPYPHATAGCKDARCTLGGCAAGYGDCDGQLKNGCETSLVQTTTCRACDSDCNMLAHVVSVACGKTGCENLKCEAGFGDCDGDPKNGCEQPLKTADHCGTCKQTCAPANASASCDTGACVISACATGFDDCNHMVEDGCEAALDGDANCGACDNACKVGTVCKNGGCACDTGTAGCDNGAECCSGVCINTAGSCFPWPCIPGTTRDKHNCGGCGTECAGWCCG